MGKNGPLPFPCGHCLSCLVNARRVWTARLILEAQCHEHSFFSTLTYEVEPDGRNVVKSHLSQTLHRLRDRARQQGKSVRFFGCGEYGENGGRPHYHVVVFGLSPGDEQLLDRAWAAGFNDASGAKPGFVHHGYFSADAAAYICGYVVKKLTNAASSRAAAILKGRNPEFALMSRRPGIGKLGIQSFIDALESRAGAYYLATHRDVPTQFAVGSRMFPLARLLRHHLRLYFFGDHRRPREAADIVGKEAYERKLADVATFLPPLQVDASVAEKWAAWDQASREQKKKLVGELLQKKAQQAFKYQLRNSRKKL